MAAAAIGDFRVSGCASQEATMMDVGEKERPPGDPPDKQMSWAMRVVGCNGGGVPVPEDVLDDAFVLERLRLEFPDGEGGEPVITIGEEVLDAMNGLWKNCMIVKVLGRNVSVAVLSKRLREMWNPARGMHVMDLPRQFFMVRFEGEEEYLAALTGGPWRVFGSYLMVQAWSPDFDPARNEIQTTPVWVRLANLPVNLYHKTILMGIAKGLGKPIKVDLTTLKFERARYARVCVEIDLSKPLKGSIIVNGVRYYVSYEGLMKICSNCGMYGHLIHTCPKRVMSTPRGEQERNEVVATQRLSRAEPSVEKDGTEESFTVVRTGGRRSGSGETRDVIFSAGGSGDSLGQVQRAPAALEKVGPVPVANRFGRLAGTEDIVEDCEAHEMTEANKENENPISNLPKVQSVGYSNTFPVGEEPVKKRGENRGRKNEKGNRLSMNVESRGSRLKQGKGQSRLMRGLVFGTKLGEIEISPTGKRMRMESAQTDRRTETVGSDIEGGGGVEVPRRDIMLIPGDTPLGMEMSTVRPSGVNREEDADGELGRKCSEEGMR